MVCDLSGYRGGVYFEAGFAEGLGLPVIYTCSEDWVAQAPLFDSNGKRIDELEDESGNRVKVTKEGVHFDLEHRPQIRWTADNPDGLRYELTNCIKAIIP